MSGRDEAELLPRNLYFDAVDRQMYTEGLASKIIPMEQGRRHKQVQTAVKDAEQLIQALKSSWHFDRPGNVELVLPQIADTLDDLTKHVRNFIADVETAAARYRRVNESIYLADAAVEPTPQAPAAPAADSSPVSPIAGEDPQAGAVVAPNAAAPAAQHPLAVSGSLAEFERGVLGVWGQAEGIPLPPKPGPRKPPHGQSAIKLVNPVVVSPAQIRAQIDAQARDQVRRVGRA